ncbi:LexA family transcriptional regulator [Methylosinus sp. H3A]|uniref:LexA family transcriptional regulator n=1 Tax=Methylosinus sp. H3A TaxID=2785786 RepID=UPI0018C32CDD|nr:LexA family transcriptional regulator [Methylosinus sp. H3A]MBG0809893.1 LexA family transcriptional regulator [Methylosinus sp. H3A]
MVKKPVREETRLFGERVRGLVDRFDSLAEAARFLEVAEQTLRNACSGEHEPRAPLLIALSEKFSVSMDYLLGLSDELEPSSPKKGGPLTESLAFERIPRLDVRAAAGAGAVNHIFAIDGELAFPHWMLKKLAPAGARLSFLRATGDSMEPTIADGALLLVCEAESDLRVPDRAPKRRNEWDHTDIYVFLIGNELRVKRIRKAKQGTIVITSDNPVYPPEVLLKDDLKRFKICGRVVWWDNRL